MNHSQLNPSTTPNSNPTHSTAHAIRSNVVPATPHTVIHNGVPCVAIPVNKYQDLFDDVEVIKSALMDYYHLIALLATNQTQNTLKAWTVDSLHSVMHLNLDIHTDIMSNLVNRLTEYLPPDHPNHKAQTA